MVRDQQECEYWANEGHSISKELAETFAGLREILPSGGLRTAGGALFALFLSGIILGASAGPGVMLF